MADVKTILHFEGEQFVLTHPCVDCGIETHTGSLCPACLAERKADADDYDQYEADDLEEEDDFEDCGLMVDGQCANAGTEWCDFECANRNSELFAGSRAWMRAHGSACSKCDADIEDGEEPGAPRLCGKCGP